MGIWKWLFGSVASVPEEDHTFGPAIDVNPPTGLPMLTDAVDVMGNPYGFGNPGGLIDSYELGNAFQDLSCHGGSAFDDFM